MGEMLTYADIAWFSRLEVMKETAAASVIVKDSSLDEWMKRLSRLLL
jgi:hypothetical protein